MKEIIIQFLRNYTSSLLKMQLTKELKDKSKLKLNLGVQKQRTEKLGLARRQSTSQSVVNLREELEFVNLPRLMHVRL